jgi:nitrite reductase/ring-hydroxylating ferredoxin subunit
VNPARPQPGDVICALDGFGDPEARAVDFRAGDAVFSLIIVRRGDLVRAYENRCPHARMPLDRPDGRVIIDAGGFLVCAMHGASFDAMSGACAGGPADAPLTPFAIAVRDGAVVAA